jgi:hypothetical protein
MNQQDIELFFFLRKTKGIYPEEDQEKSECERSVHILNIKKKPGYHPVSDSLIL